MRKLIPLATAIVSIGSLGVGAATRNGAVTATRTK